MSNTANPTPDWYPDPTGRFEQRYWDGTQWTEHASSAGQQRSDPLPGAEPPSAGEELPSLADLTPAATPAPEPVPPSSPAPTVVDAPAVQPEAAAPSPAEWPVSTAAAVPVAASPVAEWYPDPTGRFEQRYWDGGQWTEHVSTAGRPAADPLPDEGDAVDESTAAAAPDDTSTPEDAPPAGEVNPFASSDPVDPSPAEEATAPEAPAPVPDTASAPVEATDVIPAVDPEVATGDDDGDGSEGDAGEDPPPDDGPPPGDGPGPTPGPTPAPTAAGPAADWYPDPTGRQELRYWDGAQWTEHASSGGRQVVDPVDQITQAAHIPVGDQAAEKVQKQVQLQAGAVATLEGGGSLFTEPILVVNQKWKVIEINSEYAVYDQHGNQIGAVRQVGQSAAKKAVRVLTNLDQFLTHSLQVVDMAGAVQLTMTRPAKFVKSKVEVGDGMGQPVGTVIQQNAIGKIRFSLEAGGHTYGSINAENWRAWNFNIQDHTGAEVARITKTWEGLAKTMFTTADNYVLQIHRPIEEPLRSLVVASALCVDTALKQDSRGLG